LRCYFQRFQGSGLAHYGRWLQPIESRCNVTRALGVNTESFPVKFIYSILIAPRGLSLPKGTDEVTLVADPATEVSLRLVSQELTDAEDIDLRAAIGNLLVDALVRGSTESLTKYSIASRIVLQRENRKARFGNSPFLVLKISGQSQSFVPKNVRDMGDYLVSIDGPPRDDIRTRCKPLVDNALAALALATDRPPQLELIGESISYVFADGKPLYCYELRFLGDLSVSVSLKPTVPAQAARWYGDMSRNPRLGRAWNLLVASLNKPQDHLRAFLNAWNALEILINKVFSSYEAQFFAELKAGDHPRARSELVGRFREVLNGKHRLSDKFAIVAIFLSPTDADADVASFREVKSIRDKLAHGQDILDAELSPSVIQNLALKYLRLHLDHASSP
jgi:hypothetical protein